MLKRIALFLYVLFLTGCVTYHDRFGNPAPQHVDFDCKQKCGYYDTRMSAVGTAFCLNDCMNSQGYYQK